MLLAVAVLGGCQSPGPAQAISSVRQLASSHGFTEARIDSGRFALTVYHRGFDSHASRLVVYIEGDGRAFISRRRVSANPTPREATALRMALADPSAAVAYIARPCQFLEPLPSSCEPRWWTTHRYAAEVIDAMDQAISELQQRAGSDTTGLVGYSGGGVVAALLAQRRSDIDWLVTVAANLDHAAWTDWHEDTPLSGSLNPADEPEKLADLPQLHLAGSDDETVPPALVAGFVRRLPVAAPVELMVIDNAGHDDWAHIWRQRVCGFRFWDEAAGCGDDSR